MPQSWWKTTDSYRDCTASRSPLASPPSLPGTWAPFANVVRIGKKPVRVVWQRGHCHIATSLRKGWNASVVGNLGRLRETTTTTTDFSIKHSLGPKRHAPWKTSSRRETLSSPARHSDASPATQAGLNLGIQVQFDLVTPTMSPNWP